MKVNLISAAILLACSPSLFAQDAPPASSGKEGTQNIIIRKKGDSKEKTTIVIDGDKVTVNGKPLDEFKDKNIQIFENNHSFKDFAPAVPPVPPVPPVPLSPLAPAEGLVAPFPSQGGSKMFFRNFNGSRNNAFLGVASNSEENGATISTVSKNSPAEKAGLKEGDVITKVGTTHIDDAEDLVEAIGKYKPQDKVAITYLRDKKENTTTVTLDKNKAQTFNWNNDGNVLASPEFRNFSFNFDDGKPRLGLRVQDTENSTGVKVMDINDDDSPAAKAGLKEDDIITQVNGKAVQSVKDIKDALENVKPGDDVQLTYKRGTTLQTATVHMPKHLQSSDL